MAKTVQIRIDKDGNCHFEVSGVEGPSCEELTDALVRSAGEVDEVTLKEEHVLENPDLVEVWD
jgi:hypothetical protein